MKQKILSLTLSALLLCSGGIATSAHAMERANQEPMVATAIAHTHVWSLYNTTRTFVYTQMETNSYGQYRERAVYTTTYYYVCSECGAQYQSKATTYGSWSAWKYQY